LEPWFRLRGSRRLQLWYSDECPDDPSEYIQIQSDSSIHNIPLAPNAVQMTGVLRIRRKRQDVQPSNILTTSNPNNATNHEKCANQNYFDAEKREYF
jgi:hypothetical protein